MISTSSINSTRVSRLHDGGLEFQVKELTGAYVNLEEFYLEESVKKAIEIDRLVSLLNFDFFCFFIFLMFFVFFKFFVF